ncbi:hypothetical protein Tco_0037499, partial [Tanacetum coccineum]
MLTPNYDTQRFCNGGTLAVNRHSSPPSNPPLLSPPPLPQ